MAQINKPSEYFNTVLYTGNGGTQSITGVGFQPDFVWGKNRNTTNWHDLEDVVRGVTKRLSSNETDAEATETNNFTSFDSDGFSVGSGPNVNGSGNSIVVWNWLADNTSGSSNTDGTITSTVSASTTSGFSIVSYTGTGSGGATVGHGLGVAPKAVIVKSRGSGQNWFVNYPFGTGNGYIMLNQTDAGDGANSTVWNSTAPTSSVVTLGTSVGVNEDTTNYIMYCFAEVKGFSKFGSYTGNGSTDGTFVYTGFKPAFIMFKNASTTTNWGMVDNKRDDDNVVKARLFPNLSDTESSSFDICDFTANGFKLRTTDSQFNSSGNTFIYMAFAENPLVTSTKLPATAR